MIFLTYKNNTKNKNCLNAYLSDFMLHFNWYITSLNKLNTKFPFTSLMNISTLYQYFYYYFTFIAY